MNEVWRSWGHTTARYRAVPTSTKNVPPGISFIPTGYETAPDSCFWSKHGEYLAIPLQIRKSDYNFSDIFDVINNFSEYNVTDNRPFDNPDRSDDGLFELLNDVQFSNLSEFQNLRERNLSGNKSKLSNITLTIIYCLIPVCLILIISITIYMYRARFIPIIRRSRVEAAPRLFEPSQRQIEPQATVRFLVMDRTGQLIPIGERISGPRQKISSKIVNIEV